MVDNSVQHSNAVQIYETTTIITNWQAVGGTQHDAINAVVGLTYNNSGTVFGQRDGIYFGGAVVPVFDPETFITTFEFKAYQGGAAKVTNSGSIFGGPGNGTDVPAGAAVDFAAGVGSATLTNHASGAIDGPVGVYSEATATRITNAGSIVGETAIELQGAAAGRISNSGHIEGDSVGILVNAAAGFTITSSGTIAGTDQGILLQTGGSSVLNTGTIAGIGFSIQALGISIIDNRGTISGDLALRGTLKNSGEIIGGVTFGADNDTVINSGTIDDNVGLGNGDDTYTAIGGGRVSGVVNGEDGADTLIGGSGNDILDGGIGSDTLEGGAGNDSYTVDSAFDVVIEVAGEGSVDWVAASASYVLAADADIEFLTTAASSGTTAINLTGNALKQSITGNAGDNVLHEGGQGSADTLTGLDGNDTYRIYNSGAVIVESSTQGTADRVASAVDYVLKAGVHIEIMNTNGAAGTGGIDLTGNEIVQQISGNAGSNILDGKGGSDTMTGLGGKDFFVFSSALGVSNVDTITDFAAVDDTIRLENAIFTALTTTGTLAAAAFRANATGLAGDADDRIIYETDTGKLFYDFNGNTVGGGVHFATLTGAPTVTNADFVVI